MKNLGHYYIHYTDPMAIAIELNTILDEQNVANKYRYTVSNEVHILVTTRICGMDFYGDFDPDVVSYTTGLGHYFTWELRAQEGHTREPDATKPREELIRIPDWSRPWMTRTSF